MLNKIKGLCQKASAMQKTLTMEMVRPFLFTFGVVMLVTATSDSAFAMVTSPGQAATSVGGLKLISVIRTVLAFLEGPFGALIMVTAGLGAIVAAAMGSYKAALGLFVVGVGAFILRSLVGIFFNSTMQQVGSDAGN